MCSDPAADPRIDSAIVCTYCVKHQEDINAGKGGWAQCNKGDTGRGSCNNCKAKKKRCARESAAKPQRRKQRTEDDDDDYEEDLDEEGEATDDVETPDELSGLAKIPQSMDTQRLPALPDKSVQAFNKLLADIEKGLRVFNDSANSPVVLWVHANLRDGLATVMNKAAGSIQHLQEKDWDVEQGLRWVYETTNSSTTKAADGEYQDNEYNSEDDLPPLSSLGGNVGNVGHGGKFGDVGIDGGIGTSGHIHRLSSEEDTEATDDETDPRPRKVLRRH